MQTVTVTVGENNVITCVPDTVPMGGQGQNAVIQWQLNTSDWTFPSNGIVFGPNNQFTLLRPVANGARFQCVDANSDSNYYKYTVNLVNSKGTTASVDPGVQNGEAK